MSLSPVPRHRSACSQPSALPAHHTRILEITGLLSTYYREAYKKRWLPLLGEPFDCPPNEAPVLEYGDVVEERDGIIAPNLRGQVDPRRILADADIIVGVASKSEEQYCIYGDDHLEDGGIPEGFRTVVIRLDTENKDRQELAKIYVIVREVKGQID